MDLVAGVLRRLRSRFGRRPSPRSLARSGTRLRAPLGAAVALAGAAAALGMDAGPSSSQRAVKRASPVLPAQGLPAQGLPLRVSPLQRRATPRAAASYYRRIVRKRVPRATPAAFLALYREAARTYGVNWRLLASIHRQETAFSTAASTYRGLNAFGCCAGPMQFNVTNGPVSTWKLYRRAFRAGRRPARYPHRTRHHPSIYDDFDAIMAAALLLSDSGAGRSLDRAAWWAAYSYYGHDLFGVTYASQVLARAVAWQRDGFCPNCALDDRLVERFDDAYGAPVRRELRGADRKDEKDEKKRKKRKSDRRDRERDRERRARDSKDSARRRTRPRPPAARAPGTDRNPPAAPALPPANDAPEPPAEQLLDRRAASA